MCPFASRTGCGWISAGRGVRLFSVVSLYDRDQGPIGVDHDAILLRILLCSCLVLPGEIRKSVILLG